MSKSSLNLQQQQAVEYTNGAISIIAGPGTGKTKTLTSRIAYLIENKRARPEDILALTFTNKSAQEMKERIAINGSRQPFIGTFHALAHTLLPPIQTERLIADQERMAILQVIKKSVAGKGSTLRDAGLLISRAKNSLTPPDGTTRRLLDAYNNELRGHHLYDYDDLLLRLHAALQTTDFRDHVPHFTHILVDEFQDTNELQYAILRLLDTTGNLFVIGDPLQAIYGFRGATATIFERFRSDFPSAQQIRLTINYRSAPQVVALAGALFPDVIPPLTAHRTAAGVVQAVEVLNEYSEAEWIVNEIEHQVGGSDMARASRHHISEASDHRSFHDFAVMYRTRTAGKAIQRALEASGMPFQVVGEGSPYTQPYATAVIQSLAYVSGLADAPAVGKLTSRKVALLLDTLQPATRDMPLTELAAAIVKTLHIKQDAAADSGKHFTSSLERYSHLRPAAYVAHVQKLAEQEYYDPAAGAITLLTIHASKGLEFPVVFIVAAEDGIIPLRRKGIEPDFDEEKRLLYVAATRAKDELHIVHARTRKHEPHVVSPYIADLPKGAVALVTDPAIEQQLRSIRRRAQKRAQGTLF